MMSSATYSVLIVDDEHGLATLAAEHLKSLGYETSTAHDGPSGLRAFFDIRPDLVLLDVMMPGMDGFEVCSRIRDMADTPVIMLTARDSEEDIVRGLEIGADDYIIKPFKPAELSARVQAVLRRAQSSTQDGDLGGKYADDWLRIDVPARIVEVNGERVRLSALEFKLLAFLLKNRGRIVEANTILTTVWGPEYRDEVAYVRVYVSHIRQKIEQDPANPVYILTERQVGYLFAGPGNPA